jgi:hypothetical protein
MARSGSGKPSARSARKREQGCWVHKTANVLAKLPKSQQPKAKRALQETWMAETKAAAELAFDAFIESYALKYARAADCLSQDRDALLAFYDFPAEHWKHLRTTDKMHKCYFRTSTGICPDLLESPFLLFALRCRLSSVPTADFRFRRAQKLSRSAVAPQRF